VRNQEVATCSLIHRLIAYLQIIVSFAAGSRADETRRVAADMAV
jgi:hypothetical protein